MSPPASLAARPAAPQTTTAKPTRVDVAAVERLYAQLLVALGQDPTQEDFRDTPRRAAGWWQAFLEYDPEETGTVFSLADRGDQHVMVRDIHAWSICQHHLLPFHVRLAIAYLPHGQVLGLSKLVRIAQAAAHRLQLQERLTAEVAEAVAAAAGSADVGVWAEGEHLCMRMRGVCAQTAAALTSCLLGRLRSDHHLADRLQQAACQPSPGALP